MSTNNVIREASFDKLKAFALSHYSSGIQKKRAILVLGAPGCAKTALGYAIAYALGYKPEEIGLLRPSLHTPVDNVGVPSVTTMEFLVGDVKTGLTKFNPPEFIHKLHTGEIKFLILDEVPDAAVSVQNIWCGGVYDYDIGGVTLHPDLNIYCTGNRLQDRSGAGRVVTKFQNRVYQYEMAHSVDATVNHFIETDVRSDVTAYIHWRGEEALYGKEGFQPNDPLNCSPRQWEEVGNIDPSLPADIFLLGVQGLVPHAYAVEYVGFRDLIADLPPISQVINDPANAPVSTKTDVCYALISRLVTEVRDARTFQSVMVYVIRMQVEMQTLFINTIRKRVPEIKTTPEYTQWCTRNQALYGATV